MRSEIINKVCQIQRDTAHAPLLQSAEVVSYIIQLLKAQEQHHVTVINDALTGSCSYESLTIVQRALAAKPFMSNSLNVEVVDTDT